MIIDCFMFFNEFDLLEIRLNELSDIVDVFVLVEAAFTHRGKKKPLYFNDRKEEFSKFNIHHITPEYYTGIETANPWLIEEYQRYCGVEYIKTMGVGPSDVILLSDIDEIWNLEKVKELALTSGWGRAGAYMPLFYYYMNCILTNKAWFHARWIKGNCLNEMPIRAGKVDTEFINTGWHFSYLNNIQEKLASFCHFEYDRPPYNTKEYIEKRKANCQSLFDDESEFAIVENIDYLPEYVLNNMDRFGKYIKGANK